jgi:ribosomal protein L11 methyltransferase
VPRSWLQVSLSAPGEALDTISNFLIERGSPGVELKKNAVRAFFPQPNGKSLKRDVQSFYRALATIYPSLKSRRPCWSILKEKNWNSSWRRFFTPRRVGRRLWVTPPWAEAPPSERLVITIEPGMAFGTGTHFTTRSCLEFIEAICAPWKRKSFTGLDVGTGSGILSIALAKLGAKKVVGVDHDPVALDLARSNVRINKVRNTVELSDADVVAIKGSFDVVVANLVAETIIELSGTLKKCVKGKGYLILAGTTRTKTREVASHFASRPFELIHKKTDKEWVTLVFKKRR